MLEITAKENAVLLPVKVVPGASRTRYMGEWDGRAKIAIAAPPAKGEANKALVAFLVKLLAVRKCDVTVVSGRSNPVKTLRIEKVTVGHVRSTLQANQS